MDEDEAQEIYEAACTAAQASPMPPELKERLEVFAEAYALTEELDVTETILAVTAAWPIYRAWMEEQRG
jgi:hypothetical protein